MKHRSFKFRWVLAPLLALCSSGCVYDVVDTYSYGNVVDYPVGYTYLPYGSSYYPYGYDSYTYGYPYYYGFHSYVPRTVFYTTPTVYINNGYYYH